MMAEPFPGEDRKKGSGLLQILTWGEEGDGLHQHVLLLMQVQALQHAVEFHQRVQQKFLEATCGWV